MLKWPDDFIGKVIEGDCLDVMRQMPDKCVDLVLTSPPYDNIRDYDGYSFSFVNIAPELFRVLRVGGVLVWVVGDAVVNGSETGTSFRQALRFMDVGFRVHDTMIYEKDSAAFPESNRYYQQFEFMFVFSKGRPGKTNLIKDKPNTCVGENITGTNRQRDGSLVGVSGRRMGKTILDLSVRGNIWKYGTGYMKSSLDKRAFEHPATFPENLAADHIISWSNEGDIVFDPMAGSGTTPLSAERYGRKWIASDTSAKYCAIARARIAAEQAQGKLF